MRGMTVRKSITLIVSILLVGLSFIDSKPAHAFGFMLLNHRNMANSSQNQDPTPLLEQTMNLAKQGKVKSSEDFQIGSIRSAIVDKWGKPDEDSDDTYLIYRKRYTYFLLDNSDVTYLLTEDPSYWNVTYDQVKQKLGKPDSESRGQNEATTTYHAGEYTLEFEFYYDSSEDNPDTIEYVAVYK